MKTARLSIILTSCSILMLLFQACLDINTTSQINSNGSIFRTVTFVGDSTAIYRGDFPIPLDSSWSRRIEKLEEKKFKLTADRLFRNVDEMNAALKGTFGKTLQYTFEFKKSFQWFFTSYRFQETSLKYAQFNSIPTTDYFSSAELEEGIRQAIEKKPLATKGDSLALENLGKRFEEWEARNRFEAIFVSFRQGVESLNDPSLNPIVVDQKKDLLFRRSAEFIQKNSFDTLRFVFAAILRSPLVHEAWYANARGFEEFKRRAQFEQDMTSNNYATSIIMPGLITNTNSPSIEGNKAAWDDYKDLAKIFGYTMWVESREVNWWAVILTGVILVAILVLLVASTVRRKNRF